MPSQANFLFEEPKRDPETCPHKKEAPSLTVWPGETVERMTMTCLECGRYRPRYPGEGLKK
jgi:Zn ribbon nucleic-acid-binding protein